MIGRWGDQRWAAGGPALCLNDTAAANWVDFDSVMVMRAKDSGGAKRVEFQNQESILCAVCF